MCVRTHTHTCLRPDVWDCAQTFSKDIPHTHAPGVRACLRTCANIWARTHAGVSCASIHTCVCAYPLDAPEHGCVRYKHAWHAQAGIQARANKAFAVKAHTDARAHAPFRVYAHIPCHSHIRILHAPAYRNVRKHARLHTPAKQLGAHTHSTPCMSTQNCERAHTRVCTIMHLCKRAHRFSCIHLSAFAYTYVRKHAPLSTRASIWTRKHTVGPHVSIP